MLPPSGDRPDPDAESKGFEDGDARVHRLYPSW
jgi:hypothetical protein